MRRKFLCLFLSVGMVMLSAGVGMAREMTGSLQVMPVWCGEPVVGGTVTICRMGTDAGDGIQVTDGLANWIFQEGDVLSDDWLQWVLDRSNGETMTGVMQSDTGATFQDLDAGIYLVRQTEPSDGYACFSPFLAQIPENSQWAVTKRPSVISLAAPPPTADRPAPIIGAMGIGFSVAVLMVLADGRKK